MSTSPEEDLVPRGSPGTKRLREDVLEGSSKRARSSAGPSTVKEGASSVKAPQYVTSDEGKLMVLLPPMPKSLYESVIFFNARVM
jgi:hypothetical protein